MPAAIDSIEPGQRYGRLLVLRRGAADRHHNQIWICRCDCGSERPRKATHLASGAVKSCGCMITRLPKGQSGLNAVFGTYRRKALKRGYSWTLTLEQVGEIVARPCVYCGAPPSRISSTRGTGPVALKSAGPGMAWGAIVCSGIDRIDNARGYEPGNVVPCCWMCNRAKHQSTVEEFLAWGERLHRHQQQIRGAVANG